MYNHIFFHTMHSLPRSTNHTGLRHGVGKMFYNSDKTVTFNGDWKDGLRNGYGTMRYASGNYYEGYWEDDKKCGTGVMIWKDVDEVYTGQWENDRCNGVGEHLWGDGATNTTGSYRKHCNLYRGEWRDGLRTGRGTFFYADGSQYTGQWLNNLKEGEGTFVQTNGKLHRGLFTKDRSISGEAVRATDNVCIQIHLNIDDVIDAHPHPYSDLIDGITPQNPKELKSNLEKLMLRFHTQIKTVYKRYTEVANRRRHREKFVCPENATQIERAIFNARNIQKRINCMTLRNLKQFSREMGLINNFSYTANDVSSSFKTMKQSHRNQAKQASIAMALEKITEKYAKTYAEQRAADVQTVVDKIAEIDKKISADITNHEQVAIWREEIEVLKQEIQAVEAKPFAMSREEWSERDAVRMSVQNIDSYLYYEDFLHESDTETDVLDDLTQPLNERDFYEMLVRLVADASSRDGYVLESLSPSSSSSRSIPCIYDAVFKFLSTKILPYYNELHNKLRHECFSAWSKVFHEDHMEKALLENEQTLRKIWSQISTSEDGSSCSMQDLLVFFKSLQPTYIISEATEWAILRELELLPALPSSPIVEEVLPPPAPEETVEGGENADQTEPEAAAPKGSTSEGTENNDEETKEEEADPPPPPPYRIQAFAVTPTRADLSTKYYDVSALLVRLQFDGFVELFCKLINSELWRSVDERRVLEDIESIEKSRAAAAEFSAAADTVQEGGDEEQPPVTDGDQEKSSETELPVVPQHLLEKREVAFNGRELAEVIKSLLKYDFA